MTENELSREIVDAALTVPRMLGPGLLESVYETALHYELSEQGFQVERQVPVRIRYGPVEIGEAFRADLFGEKKVIVELKSVEAVTDLHKKQLLTSLRLADVRLGLLINFGVELIRNGITRVANRLPE